MSNETIPVKLGTLIALASAVVHAEEYMETGHYLDKASFASNLAQPDVAELMDHLRRQALLPRKRSD